MGTPIAGRDRAETQELLGYFMNTLVLRTRLSGEMTFRELLQSGAAGEPWAPLSISSSPMRSSLWS